MVVERGGDLCPGCGALYPNATGPTHEYIGASAGCWALYTALQMGCEPDADLLDQSQAPWARADAVVSRPETAVASLLVDAYAAQHHGTPSPRAIQSVAVHLLVLHSVFRRGAAAEGALWVRRRALRERGVFTWLTPPPMRSAYSIRHLFGDNGGYPAVGVSDYIESVHSAWSAVHEGQLRAWYDRFVLQD